MLRPILEHSWDLSPSEAIALQKELAGRVSMEGFPDRISSVAGVDVGIRQGVAQAAVVVLTWPELEMVERSLAECPVSFPYVPGLLSFREAPPILAALQELAHTPDVLILDGQGYAHPRRFGLATHVGVVLDRPTVGCAKSRLCGEACEPAETRGSYTWLMDHGEIIGAVLRTRDHVRPVYVSVGHRICLEKAIDLILRCGRGYRLPEPTRWAHRAASETARGDTDTP
ncbi:MAG: deoxyribonuclease V [Anaerolineae bacterium]|nr:deoxyribonuclease V [Anaerolineae bacterium]